MDSNVLRLNHSCAACRAQKALVSGYTSVKTEESCSSGFATRQMVYKPLRHVQSLWDASCGLLCWYVRNVGCSSGLCQLLEELAPTFCIEMCKSVNGILVPGRQGLTDNVN